MICLNELLSLEERREEGFAQDECLLNTVLWTGLGKCKDCEMEMK